MLFVELQCVTSCDMVLHGVTWCTPGDVESMVRDYNAVCRTAMCDIM